MRHVLMGTTAALLLTASTAWAQDADANLDANDNNQIEVNEFESTIGDAGVFGEWDGDGDGTLTQSEFEDGLYSQYDDDDDGVWSEEEYGQFEDDDWF